MGDRSLIVARMNPGGAAEIARLFAASDATQLPLALGVRRRRLFSYADLYLHYVEFTGDRREALQRAAQRPDFKELSAQLAEHVAAYDPATWRSPADAMATEFYSWTPPHLSRGTGR
jgi:hypothetical protein